jgi:hypothetical protein
MIFVPCRDGVSHNEAEFSSKEQCARRAQVLLQAVLDYDRGLAERQPAALVPFHHAECAQTLLGLRWAGLSLAVPSVI